MATLSMDYAELENTAVKAMSLSSDLRDLMSQMSNAVNAMCDGWTATASPVFRDDYAKLAQSANQISELVDQLSGQVQKYSADMQALDAAYSTSKIG